MEQVFPHAVKNLKKIRISFDEFHIPQSFAVYTSVRKRARLVSPSDPCISIPPKAVDVKTSLEDFVTTGSYGFGWKKQSFRGDRG
jgi:hypothetical protein